MFERFTAGARQVIVCAHDEAGVMKHNYIGTEHLLLGLLREEDGSAARALASLGIPLREARTRVAQILGIGDERATGQLPFTPRAKGILKHALGEARSLDREHVEPGHILLSLLSEGEGVAARVLMDRGVDTNRLRSDLLRQMDAADDELAGP